MEKIRFKWCVWIPVAVMVLSLAGKPGAYAAIDGEEKLGSSPVFNLVATPGHIQTTDGDSFLMWGFAVDDGRPMYYPGPTLIVKQGAQVTLNLRNNLPADAGDMATVSVLFPGHQVSATGGVPGLMGHGAAPGGTVIYTFTADKPGTYLYHAADPVQVEMGLVGALIVRPSDYDPDNPTAYGAGTGTNYNREFLYLLTEMDPRIHRFIEFGEYDKVDMTTYYPVNWFVNGRNFPDVMAAAGVPWLPNQPYNCQPRMHPGETVLLRVIGADTGLHPMHYHGNDFRTVAENGRLLSSNGTAADRAWKDNTINVTPGQTADLLWTWNGRELGWDIYNHALSDAPQEHELGAESSLTAGIDNATASLTVADGSGFPAGPRAFRAILWSGSDLASALAAGAVEVAYLKRSAPGSNTFEFAAPRGQEGTTARPWASGANVTLTDHGKVFQGSTTASYDGRFPVQIPPRDDLTFGQFYHGSPFLGALGTLPPGHPGLNQNGAYFYMWHSHREKELTSNDIFPGGLLTFMIIEPPGVAITE